MGAFSELHIGITEDRTRFGYSLKEIAVRNRTTVKNVAETLVEYYQNEIEEVNREFKREMSERE